jgi:hypothetical protein
MIVIFRGYYLRPVGGEDDVRVLSLRAPLLVQSEMMPEDLPVGSSILNS